MVPVLCNSSISTSSRQSHHAKIDYSSEVWDKCHNVSIISSPFALINSTLKLTDLWQSESAFCDEFGGPSDDGATCLAGGPVLLNNSENLSPPSGICLEKIGNCHSHSIWFQLKVTRIRPVEVRRIFTMGLPFTSHHGGQILFGPKDGYLYFMMGDGGGSGDTHNKRGLRSRGAAIIGVLTAEMQDYECGPMLEIS